MTWPEAFAVVGSVWAAAYAFRPFISGLTLAPPYEETIETTTTIERDK